MSETINLVIKWAGKEIPLDDICVASTVGDLKKVIEEKTSVLPGRQKLLNLKFKGIGVSVPSHKIHILNFRAAN